MKIHVLSDLHTEFAAFAPPRTEADVIVLAGDIGVGAEGIEWAAGTFPDRPVVYVTGNHEYYGHDIGLAADLRDAAPDNVRVLENAAIEIDGVRFLGSTLWTDFDFYGEAESADARRFAQNTICDLAWKGRAVPNSARQLDHQPRPKIACFDLARIPARIADDARAEDLVVAGGMRMAVNPEFRPEGLDLGRTVSLCDVAPASGAIDLGTACRLFRRLSCP